MQKNLLILPNEPFPLRLYFVQKSAILFIRGGTRLLAGIRPGIKKCARPRLFCAEASADDKERENSITSIKKGNSRNYTLYAKWKKTEEGEKHGKM